MPPVVDAGDAKQAVESLRDGVPPTAAVARLLTVGQSRLRDRVESDLQAVAAGGWRSVLVVGDYGTGKSHFIRDLLGGCLEAGFAVAYCAQDIASRIALNRPDQVYRQLVSSFAVRLSGGETGDLAALANAWAKMAQRVVRQEPKTMRRIYTLAKRKLVPSNSDGTPPFKPRVGIALVGYLLALEEQRSDVAETMLSVISGAELTNTKLLELAVGLGLDRPKRHIGYIPSRYDAEYYLSLLGVLAGMVVAAGGKGLVVLFDEMEALAELPRVSEEKAHRVLDELLLNTAGLTCSYGVLAYTPAFMSSLRGRRSNGASGAGVSWAQFLSENEMRLQPLTGEERAELGRRLGQLHGIAYGWDAELALDRLVAQGHFGGRGAGSTRDFVRRVIDDLDRAEQSEDRRR